MATEVDSIERIVADSQVVKIGEDVFSKNDMHLVRNIDRLKPVAMSTLKSLVDFAKNTHLDEGAYLTIDTDNFTITLQSGQRYPDGVPEVLAKVVPDYFDVFPFGLMVDSLSFQIKSRCLFKVNDDLKEIFRITQTIDLGEKITVADNGLSMQMTLRRGASASSASMEEVGALRKLMPYRCYPEVAPPEQDFLLRIEDLDGLKIGLFEAGGGLWRTSMASAIKEYLVANGIPIDPAKIYC